MRQRPSLWFVVPFGLACLLIGMMLGRPATGQQAREVPPQPERPGAPWRYQAVLGGRTGPLVVIDTVTGRCWSTYDTTRRSEWKDLGTPAPDGK